VTRGHYIELIRDWCKTMGASTRMVFIFVILKQISGLLVLNESYSTFELMD
jgi:hypothetical protein